MCNSSTTTRFPIQAALRWAARSLSGLLLLAWGVFIVGHVAGDEGDPSRPLTGGDYLLVTMMGIWLAGLAVGWKWELAGGIATLAALAVAGFVNPRVLAFPGTLIAVVGILFLASWWFSRRRIRAAASG